MVVGAMKRFLNYDRKVSNDMSLGRFEDLFHAACLNPALDSVDPLTEMMCVERPCHLSYN